MNLKFSGRLLSLILSITLITSMLGFSTISVNSVNSGNIVLIQITDVVKKNGVSADLLDGINAKRKAAGLSELRMTNTLLSPATKRAAQLTIYYNSEIDLEGQSFNSLSTTDTYRHEIVLKTTKTSTEDIITELYSNSEYTQALSKNADLDVGIGVIVNNSETTARYICIRLQTRYLADVAITSSELRNKGDVKTDPSNYLTDIQTYADIVRLNGLCLVWNKYAVSNNSITMRKGEQGRLLYRVTGSSASKPVYIRAFSYVSDAQTVVKDISAGSSGTLSALASGNAKIKVSMLGKGTSAGKTDEISVKVLPADGEKAITASLSLSASSGYAGTAVTGTITASNGTEPYTYKVKYTADNGLYGDISTTGNTFKFTPTLKGKYTITATVTDSDGNNATAAQTYQVADQLSVTLKSNKSTVALGNTVTLTSNVSGGVAPITYKYAYENGSVIPGTSNSVTFTPTEKGAKTVVVTATDVNNKSATSKTSFNVVDAMKLSVTADNNNIAIGETAILTASCTGGDTISSYTFTCTDSNGVFEKRYVGDQKNVAKFSASVAGKYTINVKAEDASHNTAETSYVVTVSEPLSVTLTANPVLVSKNQTVTLTTTPTGGSGSITYKYAYDDGTSVSGTGKTTTTSRSSAGTYKVIVTATDSGKHTALAEAQFTVADSLEAVLTASKETINVGDSTVLTAVAAGASSSAAYTFSGASGLSVSGNKATFKPAAAGEYTIKVTVKDGAKSVTADKKIRVYDKLSATLAAGSEQVEYNSSSPKKVVFTAAAAGGEEPYNYKFTYNGTTVDNGVKSVITIPANQSGTFTVSVSVTDKNGYTATAQKSIQVIEPLNYVALKDNGTKQLVLGESIEFTATSTGGFQPITYTFLCNEQECKNGGQFTITNGNKLVFTPTAVGTYVFNLKAVDSSGKTLYAGAKKTITVIRPEDKLNITVSASSNYVLVGKSVTFTATVSGGTAPYSYVYNYDGTKSSSSSATKSYSPKAGSHTLEVTVTDKNGSTATASTKIEAADPLKLSLSASKEEAVRGETVTLTANGTGGFSPLTYTFTETTGAKFTSSGNTATFNPTAAGTYTFKVSVSDSKGNKSSEVSKTITVKEKLSVSLTATPQIVAVGSSVSLKSVVTGGFSTYKYKYAYADGTAISGTSSTKSITTTKAGNYTVIVTVTDSANNTATARASFTVTEKLSLTAKADKETMLVNDTAVITANASGGTSSLSYSFTCSSSSVKINAQGNKATVTATTANTSGYTITVKVTDNNNSKNYASQSVKLKVANPLTLKLSASPTNVTPGSTVTVKSTVSGGFSGVTYKYSYKNGGAIEGTTSSVKLTPTQEGTYTVVATATDSYGYTATAEVTFYVAKTFGVFLEIDKEKLALGGTANITATAAGGLSPVTYTYTSVDGLKVSGNKASFTPTKTGGFTIKVTAKDATGKTVTASKTITVKKPLTVKLTATPASVGAGNPVTLKAATTDGFGGVTYKYNYKNGEAISGTTYTTKVTPQTAGTYTVVVTATDAGGYTAKAETTFTVLAFTANLKTANTAVCVGDTVRITASSANGVSTSTYTFDSMQGLTTSGKSTAVFKPTATGTFTVRVTAKDTAGHTAVATVTLKVAEKLKYESTLTISGKNVSSSATVAVGQKVTLNGSASGGSGIYVYGFYYKKSTDKAWSEVCSPFTVDNTTLQFDAAGKYQIKIEVVDMDGRVQTKTYTVTVK